MKYREIAAGKLTAAGVSWGSCNAVTQEGWRHIVDARREGRRYIVHSDELLSAFSGVGSDAVPLTFRLDKFPQFVQKDVGTRPGAVLPESTLALLTLCYGKPQRRENRK